MEKQIRDIIGQHVGGTYEAKQKAVDEILLLFSVMQRSEQLIAFCDWYKTTDFNCEGHSSNDCVDEYLKSN